MSEKSICILPEIKSVGGPATFQKRLIREAASQGVSVHTDPDRKDIGAFLVIGAPRRYFPVFLRARQRKIPVIQRLNGMNWIHRIQPTGWLYGRKADFANFSLSFFRSHIASGIVYQSRFCEAHWNDVYGEIRNKPTRIIYNGVDLELFRPTAAPDASGQIRILIVEGNLQHGSEFNLEQALQLAESLAGRLSGSVLLQVAGNVAENARANIESRFSGGRKNSAVEFLGVVSQERLIQIENESHLLFSAELHPACPNAVIEALGCGLPVIGFDTGSLKDVVGKGGVIVPYGADAWKLEKPVLEPLVEAAVKVVNENQPYRAAARAKAEAAFGVDQMTRGYLDFLLG